MEYTSVRGDTYDHFHTGQCHIGLLLFIIYTALTFRRQEGFTPGVYHGNVTTTVCINGSKMREGVTSIYVHITRESVSKE